MTHPLRHYHDIWQENVTRFHAIALKLLKRVHGKTRLMQEEALSDVDYYTWTYFMSEYEKGNASFERLEDCLYYAIKKVSMRLSPRFGSKSRDVFSQAAKDHCTVELHGNHVYYWLDNGKAEIPDLVAAKMGIVHGVATIHPREPRDDP